MSETLAEPAELNISGAPFLMAYGVAWISCALLWNKLPPRRAALAAMFVRTHFTMIPFVFSTVGTVYFLMYTWLYQTAAYLILSVLTAAALMVVYVRDRGDRGPAPLSASRACLLTGIILLATAALLTVGNLVG